jgi:hypothetical protein
MMRSKLGTVIDIEFLTENSCISLLDLVSESPPCDIGKTLLRILKEKLTSDV